MMDATFWALIALVIFLALMVYLKVPGVVGKSLDGRAEREDLEQSRVGVVPRRTRDLA